MAGTTHSGRLLVATPALTDPNFERAVVLVLDHDADGALGVVLNRPTSRPTDTVLEGWDDLLARPCVLFTGGPVEQLAVVGLGLATPDADPDRAICGRIRAVDLSAEPGDADAEVAAARVFSGYAGWAPGQLEEEIEEDDWIVVEALDEDVVTADPAGLWRRVLARQRGMLRVLATFPDDPRLN
jgi:putative transcriptional regulator